MVAVLVLLGYVAVYLAMVGMSGQSPGKKFGWCQDREG